MRRSLPGRGAAVPRSDPDSQGEADPLPETKIERPDLRRVSALLIVPAILVIADVAANQTALKFLLLPPLGALTYLVFVNPGKVQMNVRRVVICPTATALFAWALANTIG